MASPANFSTSPPCRTIRSISGPKQPLTTSLTSSAPRGPRRASLSVSAVKPEMSEKSTAACSSSERGSRGSWLSVLEPAGDQPRREGLQQGDLDIVAEHPP